jgi:hypothetical protein
MRTVHAWFTLSKRIVYDDHCACIVFNVLFAMRTVQTRLTLCTVQARFTLAKHIVYHAQMYMLGLRYR